MTPASQCIAPLGHVVPTKWVSIFSMSDATRRTPDANPWDQRLGFWWIAEDHPDLRRSSRAPTVPRTYGELAGDAHQLVHLFRALGAGAGDADRRDGRQRQHADRGVARLPGVGAALHPAQHPPHRPRAGRDHGALGRQGAGDRRALRSRCSTSLDADALGLTVFAIGSIPGVPSLAEARAEHPRTEPADRRPGGLFVYTSGTTGKPKGIRRPIPRGDVGQVANDAAVFGRAFDFRPFDGPMLVSTGMFHGGSHSYYMAGLHVGHALVIMAKFDAEQTLQLIEQPSDPHRLHGADPVPPPHAAARGRPRPSTTCRACTRSCTPRRPCPRPLKEQMMAWWGPVIWETYGGMEGAATIAKPHRWLEKPGTVGRAIKGMQLAILDDDGNELPPGEVGHIYLDNGVGFSYHDDPDADRVGVQGQALQPRRHGLPRRRRLPVHLRPRQGHDHHRRHQRVPGRDRGRAAWSIRRSTTWP